MRPQRSPFHFFFRPHARRSRCALAVAVLLLPAVHAEAKGIYAYLDEDGVEHISNVPDDRRYRPVLPDVAMPSGNAVRAVRLRSFLPAGERPFNEHVVEASRSTGVDALLLHALISVESGYDSAAVSRKGASGLMQLMPETAARYGIRDVLDPRDNIRAGATYLRDLLALFGGDLELAVAAYNAGENAVLRHGRRIPPYAETQRYVPAVLAHYRRLRGG